MLLLSFFFSKELSCLYHPSSSTHRDESSLERVLALLVRHITNPRYAVTLTSVALLVADIYASVLGESEVVDELFGKLK